MDTEFNTYRVTVVMPSGYCVRHTVEVAARPHWDDLAAMSGVASGFGGTLSEYELVADHVVPA